MKKTYQKPTICEVNIQHESHILTGSVNSLSGNASLNLGGSSDEDARVREDLDWDDEW